MLEIDKFKENVLKQFSLKRDEIILSSQNQKWILAKGKAIIRVDDENYDLYRKILVTFSLVLSEQYDQLIYSILKKEQEKSPNIRKIDNLRLTDHEFLDPYEFKAVRENHNVIVGVRDLHKYDTVRFHGYCDFVKNFVKNKDDELCIVTGCYIEERTAQSLIRRIKRITKLANISIMDVPSFLLRFYGKEAKRCFENMAVQLNEELDEVVGYSITEICSSKTLAAFKRKLADDWANYDFVNNLCASMPIGNKEKIVQKFLTQERYRVLFSEYNFSDCYITSEWFYQKYASNIKVTNLDMTAVVAGYFKSIEQLLDLFIVSHGQLKVFEYNGYEEIKVGDSKFKSMLGKMHKFLKNNKDLFDEQNEALQNYYLERLNDWIAKCRNGYFHKDNISDPKVLSKIRNETLSLYLLTFVLFRFED